MMIRMSRFIGLREGSAAQKARLAAALFLCLSSLTALELVASSPAIAGTVNASWSPVCTAWSTQAIPSGATAVATTLYGAGGGGGGQNTTQSNGEGGGGTEIQATFNLTGLSGSLYVLTGCGGGGVSNAGTTAGSAGNGGAATGGVGGGGNQSGGAGGGGTILCYGTSTPSGTSCTGVGDTVLAIAGGGGGGGGAISEQSGYGGTGSSGTTHTGGSGAGAFEEWDGNPGAGNASGSNAGPGGAGSTIGGGAGASGGGGGTAATAGTGTAGGAGGIHNGNTGGGGGGGGYFGGGGGGYDSSTPDSGNGGGSGSSYVNTNYGSSITVAPVGTQGGAGQTSACSKNTTTQCTAPGAVQGQGGARFYAGAAGSIPTATFTVVSSPTVTAGGPGTVNAGTAIAASSISSVLASGSSPTGTLSFTVFGPQASAPTTCTSGGTPVGAGTTVTGNATYHPSAGFTPTAAGDYWWYASYAGDSNNNPAASTCGSGMSETVVNPTTPTKVVFSAEPPTTGTAGSALGSFTVSVEDANGNVETGSNTGNGDTINLTVNSGPGTIASGASAVASNGVATFSSTILNTAGSYTLTATDTSRSLTTATSSPPTVIAPTTPSKVVFSTAPPTTGTAGTALTSFAASVEDTFGNVETGSNTGHADTINLSVATGPGTIASGASAVASNGVATFSSTILNTAGSYTLTATDGSRSITTATSSPATVISPASGTQFVLTPATGSPNAGAGDNLTITAEDTFGNTITTYVGSHNLTFGGASTIGSFTPTVTNSSGTAVAFGSSTAINFVTGQATISGSSNGVMTLYKAGSSTITVTDGGSYSNGAGTTVTVNPATPNKVVFTTAPPTTGTAGTALSSFAASVEDTYGNVETGSNTGNGDTINLTVATGPGTIASGASAVASGGVASFSSTIINTAGSYTLTGTDGSRSITTATSSPATVIAPGAPTKVVFSAEPPTTGTAGSALGSFTVSVEDANGNVETGSNTGNGDTINLTVNSGPGTIASGASAVASNGVATFSSTILNTAGSYTFKAADGSRSITTATSSPATVIAPGAPTKVVFSAEPPTTGTAGSALGSFTVSVEDANGNVETGSNTGNGDTINLTVNSGPGTIASGASAVASNGVATFSSTILNTAGSYTLTATDTSRSLTTATSSPPTVIAPTTPSKVVFSTAPPTTGTAGTALTSFAASVEDTFGNVETGSNTGHADTINLSVATGPGTIASGASAVASNGVATFSSTILNTAGSYTLTATDGSRSITTATSSPATVISPASGTQFVLTPATGSPNAGAGDNLTITAEDTFGNTITTYVGSHNLTFGGASTIGSFTPTVTNSSGTAVAFGSSTAINFVTGQATISGSSNGVMTLYKAGSSTITVTDGGSYSNGAGTTVTVNPATPNKVVFTTAPPTTGTAGTALSSFAASVEDTYGNVETGSNTGNGDTINLTVATGPGTIASGASAVASGGVASFSSTIINTAGSYTLTGTDGSRSITTATSSPATVIAPGAPTKVVFSAEPPTTGTAGSALGSFTVSVEDANGNVETGSNTGNGDTINLTVNSGPGTIASGASAVASNGVATFSSTILNTAGSYTFKATTAPLTSPRPPLRRRR